MPEICSVSHLEWQFNGVCICVCTIVFIQCYNIFYCTQGNIRISLTQFICNSLFCYFCSKATQLNIVGVALCIGEGRIYHNLLKVCLKAQRLAHSNGIWVLVTYNIAVSCLGYSCRCACLCSRSCPVDKTITGVGCRKN